MDVFDLINKIGLDILKPIAHEKKFFDESNTYINAIYSSLYNILKETIVYPELCLDKVELNKNILNEKRIDIEYAEVLFRKNKNLIYEKIYLIRENILMENNELENSLLLSLEKSFKDIEKYFKNYEKRIFKTKNIFRESDSDFVSIKKAISRKNKSNLYFLKKDYES